MKENLNAHDLDIIYRLVDAKIDNLVEAMSLWTEFGDEPPDYIQETFAEYNDLRNKILRMMK